VLVRAGNIPIFQYSLKRFAGLDECEQIVLVASPRNMEQGFFDKKRLASEFGVSEIVAGGEHRVDSVRAGLAATNPAIPVVAVHDAARPFVSARTILAVVREAGRSGAAIAAVRAGDTLKSADGDMWIEGTVSREGMWRAQTPQAFRRELLERAFAEVDSRGVTDDAQLVELLGGKVRLVPSETTNLKITTAEDLRMAQALLPVWEPDGNEVSE
jgi:2-C-methyl-D-erythritol 4-phosphate cytidylyltransferase